MNSEEQKIYDQYALIIWNICETVYDRNKVDKTWYPVLKKERTNHFDWIKKPENRKYFKDEFLKFIDKDENFERAKIPPKNEIKNRNEGLERKSLNNCYNPSSSNSDIDCCPSITIQFTIF